MPAVRGRLVLVLEGGYHIEGLTESVKAVLKELRDETQMTEHELDRVENEAEERFIPIEPLINRIMEQINPYWRVFK